MAFLRNSIPLLFGALAAVGCEPNPTTGTIVLTIEGLPAGVPVAARVTGPDNYATVVPATGTLEGLIPGEYLVRVQSVTVGGDLYTSSVTQQMLNVAAGETESSTIPYALTSGSMDFTIAGLPAGAAANVIVRRADGFARLVPASGVQRGLGAGSYTIHADTTVTAVGDKFGPSAPQQTVTIAASQTPVPVNVAFSQTTGAIALTLSGLPDSLPFDPVTITGPGAFALGTTVSATLRGLSPGTYTVSAVSAVGDCPTMYTTLTPSQTVDVAVGATADASVAYSEGVASPAELNVKIANAHVTQVVQDSLGTVPIVAGRTALLRVFGLANQCNTSTPPVRVTFSNGTIVNAPAGEGSIRTRLAEGVLTSTWNVAIPDTAVKEGLTYYAEIDPDNAIPELDKSDNRFPATSVRMVNVRTMAPVGIHFVPIALRSGQSTINSSNADQYLSFSRKVHPVATFDVTFRQPLTVNDSISGPNDINTWIRIVTQLDAARVADSISSPTARFYHGIVNVPYNGGIAGIALVGGRVGLTWHHLPSASATVAHELGHNFAQEHAPCGGPALLDPGFPYAGARIGRFGYDAETQTLKDPGIYADLMSYCGPEWISDYMYVRMMDNLSNRQTLPMVAGASASEPMLLVWGRIVNGQPVLEPAFEIAGRGQLPRPGPHRITATATDGSEAFSVAFAGNVIADLPGDDESFAITIPASMLRGRTLASLRLTARGRTVSNGMSVTVNADPRATVTRAGPRAARVRWDADRFPVVMVRDPVRGEVLSFARGGDAVIVTDQQELELNFSNRVHSARMRRPIQ
ncbi:MAG: hypothetical protein WD801_16275 [Gemmatimonadaceae bacterium]